MSILFVPSANQLSNAIVISNSGYYSNTATLSLNTQGYNNGDTIYYTTTGTGQQTTGTLVVSNYFGDLGVAAGPITINRTTSTGAFTATFYNGTTPVNLTYGLSSISTTLSTPDPYFTATILLISPTGLPSALTDISKNTSTIYSTGSTNVSAFAPFTTPNVSSSILFNSVATNTDYLLIPTNPVFAFGTNNFTVECWVYATSFATYDRMIFSIQNSWSLRIAANTGLPTWYISGAGVGASNTAISINTWNHIAVVRTGTGGSQFVMYLNGQAVYTGTRSDNITTSNPLYIGEGDVTITQHFLGYISNIRIVNGVGVYTGAFTPPSSPLQATQSAGTNISAITTQTVLLLAQSPQGNLFADSANTLTQIVYVGTATQGTFSPFSLYATFFNGSNPNPYLSFLGGSGYGFGTGDFTIEYWIYATSWASTPTVIELRPPAATLQFSDNYTSGGAPGIYYNGAQQLTSSITIPTYTWAHVAYTRSGTAMTIWVNGVQGATGTKSDDLQATGTPRIGTNNTAVNPLNGYLSNVRIIKGQALYTSAFTPPPLTTRLAATTNTTLLACQAPFSGTGTDYSTLTNTVTSINAISTRLISTTTFLASTYSTSTVGGSIYFNGTTNITISTSTSNIGYLSLGAGNFSLEAWIYPTSNATEQIIFNKVATASVVGAFDFRLRTDGSLYYFASKAPGTIWDFNLISSKFVTLNSWNHVAFIRVGDWYQTFINGTTASIANIYSTPSLTLVDEPTVPINLGANANGTVRFTGFMTGVRMVKNYSLYSTNTNFNPPLAPPTASLTGTTIVLMNGSNAAVYDATGNNNISVVNSATVNTSIVKFGSQSLQFVNNSYINVISSTSSIFVIGTGDYTIECWMNFAGNIPGNEADIFESQTTNFPRILKRSSTAGLSFDYYSGALGSQLFMADASIVLGSWFHLAVSRAAGTLKGFINGSQVFSVADSTSIPAPIAPLTLGARPGVPQNSFNGYISDFRFTKLARYTASFTTATTYSPLI